MNFYTGKVPQNMPIIQYIIEIAWNNQYYSCPQKLQAIGIFDNLWKWKEASMCKTFFPLISIKYLGEFQIIQIQNYSGALILTKNIIPKKITN